MPLLKRNKMCIRDSINTVKHEFTYCTNTGNKTVLKSFKFTSFVKYKSKIISWQSVLEDNLHCEGTDIFVFLPTLTLPVNCVFLFYRGILTTSEFRINERCV